jgi:hypothetical protein
MTLNASLSFSTVSFALYTFFKPLQIKYWLELRGEVAYGLFRRIDSN